MATRIPIPSKDVKRWVRLSREMTKNILPNTIKIFQHWDYSHIYLYIMKMILLQVFYYVTGIMWILDLNLYYSNGQKVYCIAEKIKNPEDNRNFLWGIKDELFTANDISTLTKSRKLPQSVINTDIFVEKLKDIRTLQNKVIGEISRLFNKKWPWNDINVCVDTQDCRKNGIIMRQMNKWKFINILKDAAANVINLRPIILLDESIDCGYSVDGLWAFKANQHLNIGIAFRWDKQNGIQTSAIFISVALMQVHCQLAAAGSSANGFFNGWEESIYNTFHLGPMQQLQNQKKEINRLRLERDRADRVLQKVLEANIELELFKKRVQDADPQLYEDILKEPDAEIYEKNMLQSMDNESKKEEQGAERALDSIHKALAVGVLQSQTMTPQLAQMLEEVPTEHKDNRQHVTHYQSRREVYLQANRIVNNNIYANDLNMNVQSPNIFLQNRPPPPSAYLPYYPPQLTNILHMPSVNNETILLRQQLMPMQQPFMASGMNVIAPQNGYNNNNAASFKKKQKKTT